MSERATLRLRVSPGARRSEVRPGPDGELHVRVAAPPIEGKANAELIAFLSRFLGVPPSRVVLVKGASSRHKVVQVAGLTTDEALARLLGSERSSSTF